MKQFYTAPTLIRSLMAAGAQHVTPHDRSSLRVLGTVGEPINPEAWRWYHEVRLITPPSKPTLAIRHQFSTISTYLVVILELAVKSTWFLLAA